MADDGGPRASFPWAAPGLQQLARSLSKDNLQRVSSSIHDIKRQGDVLMLTATAATADRAASRLKAGISEASSRLQQLPGLPGSPADDWSLLKRAGAPKAAARRVGMRRSASDNGLRARLPRAGSAAPRPLAGPTAEEQSWDLLTALNNTLNQARAGGPVLSLPTRRSFEEQVRGQRQAAGPVGLLMRSHGGAIGGVGGG